VKPAPFAYHPVATAAEATAVLARLGGEGRILAGGQSLLPLMNFRLAQPEHVVDINPIEELAYVRRDDGRLVVGATARQAAIERSEEARHVPLLVEALRWVAHPPVRHRGTVVGSIAHADPAAELPCVALTLDARLTLASAAGERVLEADEFFLGPFDTALEPGELLKEVSFPLPPPGSGHAFVEFARRHGDFAIAGAAVALRLDGGRVADAAVGLCGVGPAPLRARAAEERLRGQLASAELVEAAAQAAVEGLRPAADIHGSGGYRVGVARAQVRKALALALDRAKGAAG
jgi:aerobic carbon-monoxide dehydrogenase medium subunit